MKNNVIIIAEAGVNHNGNLLYAKELIDIASIAGADYVKFQTFKADKLVDKSAKKADYQLRNFKGDDDTQFKMLQKLEMPFEWHQELYNYSLQKKIKFLSTGFDDESIDMLDSLNIDFFKIPSGEITNKPLLLHIAKKNRPVVISTGMCTLDNISDAVNVFLTNGISKDKIKILHCNTEYPTPFNDVNLNALQTIREKFDLSVGYSDHTLGIEVPIAAVALGAVIIEKHFTISRELDGPDHKASLEPLELRQMIQSIRNIELAMGTADKRPSESEIKNIEIARKSIFVNRNFAIGEIINENDLIMKRPGNGISPMLIDLVVGKKMLKEIAKDTLLKLDDFS